MFEKLKQKLENLIISLKIAENLRFYRMFLLAFSLLAIFAISHKALAATPQVFQPNNISLTVDTYINDSAQPGNYGTIGLDSSANLKIRVVVKLAGASACTETQSCAQSTPVSSVNFGTDSLYLNKEMILTGKTLSLNGLTIGLLNKGTKVAGQTYDCFGDSVATLTSTEFRYTTCNFPSNFRIDNGSTGGTVAVGSVILDRTFTITQSDLASFNITSPNQRYTIYAYPGLYFGGTGVTFGITTNTVGSLGGWDMMFPNGAKSVYVDSFDTQANAIAAAANPPSNVPGYGSVTSNAQATGGGNPLVGFITQTVGTIFAFIEDVVYTEFSKFIAPLISELLSVHPYQDSFVAVIYPGWIVIRNLCNILFILALIIIAMGTLFRVDSYQYKNLIVQLIIAALLINFSLVIAQAVLGLADTIQAQFLGNNVTSITTLAGQLMTNSQNAVTTGFLAFDHSGIANNNVGAVNDTFGGLVQAFFWLSLSLGTFCVFCAIAAFLFIRIVALLILLLVSPIAYACGVLPPTAQYRGIWWQNFLKYAFFTPIMAFFLNLTTIMVLNSKQNPILSQIANGDVFGGSTGVGGLAVTVGSDVMLLIFLLLSLKVADDAGVYGAHGITAWAKKGFYAPITNVGGMLGKYASRRYNEWTAHQIEGRKLSTGEKIKFAVLNPKAVYKGFKKRSEENIHAAQAEAEAVGLMVAEQTLAKGKAFNRKAIAERAHDAEFLKNYGDQTREEAVDTAFDVSTMANNAEGRAARRAIIEANMREGWIDDIIQEAREDGRGKELLNKMKNLKSSYRLRDDDWEDLGNGKRRLKYDQRTRRALYLAMFGEHLTTDENGHEHVAIADQVAAKMLADIGEKYGKSTRHAEYMSDNIYDSKANHGTGGYSFYDSEFAETTDDGAEVDQETGRAKGGIYKGQIIYKTNAGRVHARGEVAKQGSRDQAGIAHHALMDLGNGKLDKDMYAVVAKAMRENPSYAQERTANMLLTGKADAAVLTKIIRDFSTTGVLEVDEQSAQRIRDMRDVDQGALTALMARFTNTEAKEAIDKLNRTGVKLRVNGRDMDLIPAGALRPPQATS